jgi:hypothetical protein
VRFHSVKLNWERRKKVAVLIRQAETFLPFDLEYTFASVFTLRLVYMIVPTESRSPSCYEIATSILDDMKLRGNRIAEFRRAELDLLEWLIQESEGPSQTQADALGVTPDCSVLQRVETNTVDLHGLDPGIDINGALGLDWGDQTEGVGLLSEQILAVVNQLATDDVLVEGNIASLGEDRWLWDGS